MPQLTKLNNGFYCVRIPSGRFFDVAIAGGNLLLASAHDGQAVDWDALGRGDGEWRNASPFPEFSAADSTTPRRTVKLGKTKPDPSYEEAMELCDQIEEMADEMPSRAEEFTSSVCEKSADIRASVEERGRATPGQILALENMVSGMSRWLDR